MTIHDRPTPETDRVLASGSFWQLENHALKLERQRDALVEVMKRVTTIKVDGYGCCYYWDGRRIAEEILAEIDKDK